MVEWQSAVLVAACVAGGLMLTIMVIGAAPSVPMEAFPQQAAIAPLATLSVAETSVPETSADLVIDSSVTTAVESPAPPAVESSFERPIVVPVAVPIARVTAAPSAPAPAPAPAPAVTAPAPAEPVVAVPVTTQPAGPAPAVVPITVAPTSAPAPATTPPTSAADPASGLTYPTYRAASSGSVVLQYDGSAIYVSAVNLESNWVFEVEKNGPRSVEIKFFNVVTKRDSEFHASLEGGRIKVEN